MDKAFAALSAVQSLLNDKGKDLYAARLDITLAGDHSTGAVSAFVAVLNIWGSYLNERWKEQQKLGEYDGAKETATVLSRVSSWWIYANQGLIATIDNSTDVAAATAAINQATLDLTTAEAKFKANTGRLTDVAGILDGLFTFFKGVTA